MTTGNGGTILVRIQGQDIGLSELLTRIDQKMQQTTGTIRQYSTTLEQLNPKVAQDQQEQLRFAQAVANVATKVGDSNSAIKILSQTLSQVSPNTIAANNALAQLQGLLNQQEQQANRSGGSLVNLAAGFVAIRGAVQIASVAFREFAELVNAGNELEKTETTFRVLSGSSEKYQQNLVLAREQQNRFGGSLQETLDGMTEFANLSNRTGVEVNKLTNLARELATVDPAQGFKGAGIALKEFFSGNTTSLSRRFEIPKEVLNDINKLTDNKEKFEALAQALDKFGISEDLLAERSKTVAVTFDKVSGNITDLKANLGQIIGTLAQPFAEKYNQQLLQTRDGLASLQFLFTQTAQAAQINQAIFSKTQGFDAYKAKIDELNAALPFYAQSVQALTPAQYAFAQSLIAGGTAAGDAFNKVSAFAPVLNQIEARMGALVTSGAASSTQLDNFGNAALAAGTKSAEGSVFVQSVTQAILTNNLSIDQGIVALQQFAAAHDPLANAMQGVIDRFRDLGIGIDEEMVKVLADNNAKEVAKIQSASLASVLAALNAGTINQAQAESILAGRYNATSAQLPQLINLTRDLAAARNEEIRAGNELNRIETQNTINKNRAAGRQGRGDSSDAIENSNALVDSLQKASKAESDAILRNGTAAQKRSEYNKILAQSVKLYGDNSAQAIKARSDLDAFEAAQDKAAKKGGAAKLSANDKLNTALQDQQDKFNDKFEDAEQKHWDKVADIYDKYNKKQQAQFAQNEVSKRRSRADFYAGLADAPPGVDTKKFADAYEQAFATAQEIAQSGKAKLAADFLELRQKQIEELKKLDEEAAEIENNRKEGKITKKDADAQLEFLAGRRKLIEDAQKEEQDLLLKNGDSNQAALQEQLDEEEKAYAENTDKIGVQAARAADAKIKHAERSKIAVSEENKVLAQQEQHYKNIAKLNGGVVPGVNADKATAGAVTSPTAAPPKVDVSATTPLPVETTDALIVRQAELFIVHDQDVIDSLGDLGARIEGKLDAVVASINDAKNNISAAVNAVEGAVGRIRVSQPSVVEG